MYVVIDTILVNKNVHTRGVVGHIYFF